MNGAGDRITVFSSNVFDQEEDEVRTYQQIGNDWVQVGNVITGYEDGISSVALNAPEIAW